MNKDEFTARLKELIELLPPIDIPVNPPAPKVYGIKRLYLRVWQHGETGRTVTLPFWKNPGRRWYRIKDQGSLL